MWHFVSVGKRLIIQYTVLRHLGCLPGFLLALISKNTRVHTCTYTHVCIYQIDQIFKYKFCAEVLHEIIGDFFCIIFEDLQVGQR